MKILNYFCLQTFIVSPTYLHHKVNKTLKLRHSDEILVESLSFFVSCSLSPTLTTLISSCHERYSPSNILSHSLRQIYLLHCRVPSMLWSKMLMQMTILVFQWVLTRTTWATIILVLAFFNSSSMYCQPSSIPIVVFAKFFSAKMKTLHRSSLHSCRRCKPCPWYQERLGN